MSFGGSANKVARSPTRREREWDRPGLRITIGNARLVVNASRSASRRFSPFSFLPPSVRSLSPRKRGSTRGWRRIIIAGRGNDRSIDRRYLPLLLASWKFLSPGEGEEHNFAFKYLGHFYDFDPFIDRGGEDCVNRLFTILIFLNIFFKICLDANFVSKEIFAFKKNSNVDSTMDKIEQIVWNIDSFCSYRGPSQPAIIRFGKQEEREPVPVHKLRSHSFLIYKIVKLISFKATRTSFPREYH